MNKYEWREQIMKELTEAGYKFRIYSNNIPVPFVETPESIEGKDTFLNWKSPSGLPVYKHIFSDGILITPFP